MRYLILVLLLTGCAETGQFKGGATSDYRPAPVSPETYTVKDGGVKSPCKAASVKKRGDVIHLDC